MKHGSNTRALWLRARYRHKQFEGEACLLAYDDDSFGDLLLSADIKEVFERRASTANIYIAAPFRSNGECREALKSGTAIQRASSYLSGKTGNLYLIEIQQRDEAFLLTASTLTWDARAQEAQFGEPSELDAALREGWLFDLFDKNEGLVVAPAGVHFRKSSRKHTTKFLRAANALTSSAACGVLAMFALQRLGQTRPKRIFVDTAPLLSLAFALMNVAKAHGGWGEDVPSRSFSSYGGLSGIGRLSRNDVVLISATTSGSLAQDIVGQGANSDNVVTLYFLSAQDGTRPHGVLCDLTAGPERSVGYQPVVNFPASDCRLCKSQHLLAEFEGDQFLLQQRQHRMLRILRKTQSPHARTVLTELSQVQATHVRLRSEPDQSGPIVIDVKKLLSSPSIRGDFIRLLRRYCPQPLALIVRVNISAQQLQTLVEEAGLDTGFARAKVIDWADLPSQSLLAQGAGVLVVFGCLSSQTQARTVNASLRSLVNDGNVAYLSVLTLASSPEQYQDLKMFLGYGERGIETFTYREARRLALPDGFGFTNPWDAELQLLDRLAASAQSAELDQRRELLASQGAGTQDIFLPGRHGRLAIQRDFVYLDTTDGTSGISQAAVLSVVANLLCAARVNDRELASKASNTDDLIDLVQSVYGHVLISPETFLNYNDAVLKASVLRSARPSELMYEVDEPSSIRVGEVILAELAGWEAGHGDALPEFLLALATGRLRLREMERLAIRSKAVAAGLPPSLSALAGAIAL